MNTRQVWFGLLASVAAVTIATAPAFRTKEVQRRHANDRT
jgi:hypothetical protein